MAKSAHDTITATELERNLSVAIDKVRMPGHNLYITKGTQTVAELSQLASLAKSLPKLGNDASAMAKDIETIR